MPRTCKTCQHPKIDAINYDLTHNITVRNIMAKYKGLSLGGLDRHTDCIKELFDEVRAAKRAGLLASVDEVRAEIDAVRAEFVDNPNVRVGLIGKMLDAIEKEAKLTGAYIKDAPNPADAKAMAEKYADELVKRFNYTPEQAREIAAMEYSETVH